MLLWMVSLLPGAYARGYDPESCCMQAYLLNRSRTQLPWDVCLTKNRNVTGVFPVITSTLGWCKENCGSGSSLNSRLEWLPILTTWIFPMLVLLANLPVGDLPQRFISDWDLLKYVNMFWPYIEWVSVLGDPASAFCAAYSTLIKDFICSFYLLRRKLDPLDRSLIGLAMVASRTRPEEYKLGAFLPNAFSRAISDLLVNPKLSVDRQLREHLFALRNTFDDKNLILPALFLTEVREILDAFETEDTTGQQLRDQLLKLDKMLNPEVPESPVVEKPPRNFSFREWFRTKIMGQKPTPIPIVVDEPVLPLLIAAIKNVIGIWADVPPTPVVVDEAEIARVAAKVDRSVDLEGKPVRVLPSDTIRLIIQAIGRSRANFLTSVAFPMVLVFANIINTFSSAYRQLGDEDTAQGIAYGTWYMWILILSVSSNTTASSAKTQFVRDALRTSAGIRPKQIFVESVMSRNIYGNNANWFRWMQNAGVRPMFRIGILGPEDKESRFHFGWYIIWQLVGWLWVGFACANAAAVAFTTPTVGLGCRSFNHVLYAGGTLLAAMFRVFKREVFEQRDAFPAQQKHKIQHTISARTQDVCAVLYHIICTINVLVLSLGTLFQITGVYNNCKCQALFGDDNSVIDISAPTTKSRANAARYWLSMAYVAYTTAWVACGLAICTRAFIFWVLDKNFRDDTEEEKENEDEDED
ncbi:hypothetical protein H072_8498 [Dactylellina haptotyla CBS 200.50]|uniref:Uncharacterized protein n=1 Tax=Dactylellina haptotyla (strain CBS 200.50) TaxID=1284197 RepID=S8BF55_DACHA|nr:hypothetical protein H072_8498 [Dactylellina haptotyla CBS 200.50]